MSSSAATAAPTVRTVPALARRTVASDARRPSRTPPLPPTANTYTVNNTGDTHDANTGDGVCADSSGHCTLRAGIEQANASSGSDLIRFAIGTGAKTILIASGVALPTLTDTIVIDGTTQPGYTAATGQPMITLDGTSSAPNYGFEGLALHGTNDFAIGLDVQRFGGDGILAQGTGDTVENCYVGIDATGAHVRRNFA